MISNEFYGLIVKAIPILCVDIIVQDKFTEKYLLIRRKNEPLAGKFWVPGGRVLQGESIKVALHRKLLEEIGKEHYEFEFVGFYEGFFNKSAFGKHSYHTVSLVFQCYLDTLDGIILDSQSSEYTWFNQLPDEFLARRGF